MRYNKFDFVTTQTKVYVNYSKDKQLFRGNKKVPTYIYIIEIQLTIIDTLKFIRHFVFLANN